jgi:hypothetical protein
MSPWRDLVTASLIGTERTVVPAVRIPGLPPGAEPALVPAADLPGLRPGAEPALVPAADLPRDGDPGDPAAVLLDRAAMATAARRGGRRPERAEPLPESEPDPRPAVSPAAAARLARMLGGEYPGLLAEWLTAAGVRGLRPPPQFLPALLDRARRAAAADPGLVRLVAEAGGPRARWLAGLNPDWEFVTELARPGPDAWRLGDAGQRRAYLTSLLAADPDAARDLVRGSWEAAGPAERVMFLSVLVGRLVPADEPLLEAALDDRAEEVRARAARLLSALPGSALGRRMAERALRCVRIEPGASGPRLAIALPARGDDSMRRDGIPPGPAGGSPLADRTRLLLEVVARTPLPAWTRTSGLTAAQLVTAPAGDWAPVLFTGWARAAIAQQDRDWMAALISHAITGRVLGRSTEIQAMQLARRADPALGAPGALPAPPPEAPPFAGAVLGMLGFRHHMLKELENGDSSE